MTDERITLAEGTYLSLYKKNDWEYAERPNSRGVVCILPLTNDHQLILIEQHRIPVNAKVIEIPAGLVGDEGDYQEESLTACAERELLEETGYRAGQIHPLISSPTSAGMTTETTHFFCATNLTREHQGGGIQGEDITVHHVSLDDLDHWLTRKEQEGLLIDFKIHSCLWLATQQGLIKKN